MMNPRYTIVFPNEMYTEAVQRLESALLEERLDGGEPLASKIKFKNFWCDVNDKTT